MKDEKERIRSDLNKSTKMTDDQVSQFCYTSDESITKKINLGFNSSCNLIPI